MKRNPMKLEHRSQKVLPLSQFVGRLVRYALFALFLIIFSIGIGVIGYHYLAGLGWLDSFHMACLILTGMGPTTDMKTDGAKVFSSLYAIYSGVAFLTIAAVFFAPVIHRLLHLLHVEPNADETK
jgi:hypothetical protein